MCLVKTYRVAPERSEGYEGEALQGRIYFYTEESSSPPSEEDPG